ncbi:MAG: flippase-like domain-containing protein [Deltaproteobacteria bacterium]|nr:flippase-like domain-containing protein [Deltaproteobacteria bacterium]
MKRWRLLRYLLPLIGLAVLAVVVWKSGPEVLWNQLINFNWRFIPVLSLSLVNYFLFATAWSLCLGPQGDSPKGGSPKQKNPSFWRLLKVKMIGEAVNATTPLNFAAGDPLRVYLLRGDIPWQGGTRSIVVDRSLYTLAVISFIAIGFGLFFSYWVLPVRMVFQLAGGLAVLFVAILSLFLVQRRGLFEVLLKIGDRIQATRRISPEKRKELLEVDHLIRQAYREGGWRVAAAFGCHFMTRCVMVAETALILYFLGLPLPVTALWGLTAMVPLCNFVFSFIPGSLGILEGVNGLVFYFMKLNPAIGVSLQIIRHLRSGFFVTTGWLLLSFYRARNKASSLSTV